jgi:hypothetical protein
MGYVYFYMLILLVFPILVTVTHPVMEKCRTQHRLPFPLSRCFAYFLFIAKKLDLKYLCCFRVEIRAS